MPHLPAFMATAPSVPAGSYAMRDYSSNLDPPRSSPYTAPSITPYLGLRARLSQVWINRWTILLLLVLARTLITIQGLNTDLGSAKTEALSACSSVEAMGSAMASMPFYMSQGVNDLTARGVEKSINALMQSSLLAVTAIEEIVVFVINMLTSTYLCLITFAVSGSLHVVIDILEAAQDQLNTLTHNIGDDMASIVSGFEKAYNDVKNTINSATLGLGSGIKLPTLNVDDDITKLRNLQLPANLDADLQKLNNSIPTFAQVQNFTDNILRLPFEEVKRLVNNSLGTYNFDRSVFPVPQKEQMTFCSDDDGIQAFFNDLYGIVATAKKIFIALLIVAAVLVCIPMAYREIRRWNTMKERSQLVASSAHDPMDVVYIVSRPYTSTAGIKLSGRPKSERRQMLIRWVVAYATTDAALFVLSLAIAGLFTCLCQYILLKSLEKEVPSLTAQVGSFADKVVNQLNNASASWANGANSVLVHTNSTINHDMLGWVNTSTLALNNTLNQFVDLTMQAINVTFGGTPLYTPVLEVLNCLVLLKVAGIEKGLTWVHDNAHISLPLMRNDTFSLGAMASIAGDSSPDQSFLATPGDVTTDKISSAVAHFVNKLQDAIRTEAIISTFVLVIYLIVVLIGTIRAATLWFGHDKTRGNGGAAPADVFGANPSVNEFRSDNQDRFRTFDNVPLDELHNSQHDRPVTPGLPNYSTAVATKEVQHGDPEALHPLSETKPKFGNNSDIRSQRGSIWQADNKI